MTKTTGLSAFKKSAQPADPAEPTSNQEAAANPKPKGKRDRGTGDRVAVAVRLQKEDWFRLHDFANRTGTTLQKLIVQSLSKTMQDQGFPALQGEEE